MMCAIRREYSGDVKYCWPASCWPVFTSQSRNSAFRRLSGWRVIRPVTRACALIVFQFWNCGALSMSLIFSMKAVGSIGANSRQRLRLLVMTWATQTRASLSPGVPATKFGIAIGSGAKSPSGIMTRFGACPRALRAPPVSTPSDAIPEITCRRLRRSGMSGNPSLSVILLRALFHVRDRQRASPSRLSFGKHRRKIFPFVEIGGGQIIRLAFDDRAQGTLLIDAKIGRGRCAFRNRHPLKHAVALQLDGESCLGFLSLDTAIGLLPAALDLRLE